MQLWEGKCLLGYISIREFEGCTYVLSSLRGQVGWLWPTFEMGQGSVNLGQLLRTQNVRPVIGICYGFTLPD